MISEECKIIFTLSDAQLDLWLLRLLGSWSVFSLEGLRFVCNLIGGLTCFVCPYWVLSSSPIIPTHNWFSYKWTTIWFAYINKQTVMLKEPVTLSSHWEATILRVLFPSHCLSRLSPLFSISNLIMSRTPHL
jgi:hypothetical protein